MSQLIEAIECWASRPTWFSQHPSDKKNYQSAISNVKSLPFIPSTEEIYNAILHHIEHSPDMLGAPSDIKSEAMKFAKEIKMAL